MNDYDDQPVAGPDPGEYAEQYVLGAMMLSTDALWAVAERIRPGEFRHPKHQRIAIAAVSLAQESRPHDALAVADWLEAHGELRKIGGAAYLHQLTSVPTTTANADYYAEMVSRYSMFDRIRDVGRALMEGGGDGETREFTDAHAFAERARQLVDDATSVGAPTVHSVGERLHEILVAMEEAPRMYATPWPEIDGFIGGWRPGTLNIIAARPGAGKTIAALQAAALLAEDGVVAFSSLEMSEADLIKRLTALSARVGMSALSRHTLTAEDWGKVQAARSRIESLGLFIDDRSGVKLAQILGHARTVSRRGELRAVVVDYLQLLSTEDKRVSRWEFVGEITRQLRGMAKALQVPVIALAQLNRESEGEKRRLPTLSDLRESGSIEQDADTVLLLQRRIDKDTKEHTDELDVVIAKNRHGRTGRVTLLWEGQYARLGSLPWGPGYTPGTDFQARAAGE